jgi:predicted metal-dependent hydrolase
LKERRETILIGGKPLHYRVRRNRRARKFSVHVGPEDGVVVVIPWRASFKEVPPLLDEWQDWLRARVDRFDCWHGPQVRQYASGTEMLVLGRPRRLNITALPANRMRPRFTLAEDELRLALPQQEVLDPLPALRRWLRKLGRAELTARLEYWSEATGLYPVRVKVGDTRTRWGSCSARGTVSLCYRLVMAPPEVIDAVVIHELCHLRHLNHGPRFYALLERHCPDHRQFRQWLRENGDLLKL